MFQLIPYLKGYKKESVIGPLFKLLEACFELIVPLVMAKIIDVGIENRAVHFENGRSFNTVRCDWSRMFADGAVLCGKGSSWVWDGAAP